jgi:hypothetical protein
MPVQSPALAPATPTAVPTAQPSPHPDVLHATLAFQPDQPAVGAAQATLHLSDGMGPPVSGAQAQALWLMPQHAHLSQSAFQTTSRPGVYTTAVDLSMAGAWLANVTLTLPDGRSTHLQFTFNVRDRGLFGSVGETAGTVADSASGTGEPLVMSASTTSATGRPSAVSASTTSAIAGTAATATSVTTGSPPPPLAAAPTVANAASGALTQQGQVGDLLASVTLQPRIFSPAQVNVQLHDRSGASLDDVRRVDVQVAMQGMSHGARGITLTRQAPGRYDGQGMLLAMQGAWWLAVRIERGDGRMQSGLFSFQVPADQPTGAVSALVDRPSNDTEIIDIAVYPGQIDPPQLTVAVGRPVHLQVLYVDHPMCGSQVRYDAAGLRTVVSADGVADLIFNPAQSGQLQLRCSPVGLMVQAAPGGTSS